MHTQIMHIIKDDFFLVFKQVFFIIMNLENIQSNFKTINFVPYNPKKIIGNLNFKFHIFTPSNFHSMNFIFINLNTFHTMRNTL